MSNRFGPSTAIKQRGEATRQLLLDEATRQFSEFGYSGTSLNGIAVACGLGNAGALHHFASKEKLYKAVLERLSEELEARMQAILAKHASPADRLRALVRQNVGGLIEHPERSRLILRELLDNVGRLEHAKSLPLTRFVETYCRLIEAAQETGAAQPGAPIVLLAQFLGTMSYALVVGPTFARMGIEQDLLAEQQRWIEAVATAAERALLGSTATGEKPLAAGPDRD
jgi:TetR/AcrR family transcriptional regulator